MRKCVPCWAVLSCAQSETMSKAGSRDSCWNCAPLVRQHCARHDGPDPLLGWALGHSCQCAMAMASRCLRAGCCELFFGNLSRLHL